MKYDLEQEGGGRREMRREYYRRKRRKGENWTIGKKEVFKWKEEMMNR